MKEEKRFLIKGLFYGIILGFSIALTSIYLYDGDLFIPIPLFLILLLLFYSSFIGSVHNLVKLLSVILFLSWFDITFYDGAGTRGDGEHLGIKGLFVELILSLMFPIILFLLEGFRQSKEVDINEA